MSFAGRRIDLAAYTRTTGVSTSRRNVKIQNTVSGTLQDRESRLVEINRCLCWDDITAISNIGQIHPPGLT